MMRGTLLLLTSIIAACIEPLPAPGEIPEVRCGDGVTSPTEACDDGNLSDRDACTNLCEAAVCNDGIKRLDLAEDAPDYEVCDDGNNNESDGCTSLCKPPACHDGIKQLWEACDDGNAENTDACVGECVLSACGDGFVQTGVEACDPEADDATENCGENCQRKVCGNGIVEGEEECDDGNTEDADSCLNSCALARCGDGVRRTDLQEGVEGFEACDDGNLAPGDTCSVECLVDDHGNSRATATTINPGETLTARVASGDSDWFKVVAPLDGNYVFVTGAQGEGDVPPLTCSAYYPGQAEDNPVSQHVYGGHDIAGCRVSAFRAAGEILFLQLYSSVERVYDVALKPICGNGFHDPGEQCDASVGESPTNAFRCRTDCRLRQQEAMASYNICLVDEGDLLCWGSNHTLLLGSDPLDQICPHSENHNAPASRYPIEILSREANISTIAMQHHRACVVTRDGDTLACWGYEGNMAPPRSRLERTCLTELGRPHCADTPVDLVAEPPLGPISGIAMGENHQCGIWNGRIGCWGIHRDGNLGAPNIHYPTIDQIRFIVQPADAMYVQAGSFSNCAIDRAKQLWCWGRNNFGQVGSGEQHGDRRCDYTDFCEPEPVLVEGVGSVVDVVMGRSHACALNEESEVWCWGKNQMSQTGSTSDPACLVPSNTPQPQSCVRQPTRVAGIPSAIELSAGLDHTCIISDEGAVWCWGDNRSGQIGTGFANDIPVTRPRMVAGLPPVETIFLGGRTSCARHGSRVWCWGSNSMGQFGVTCGSNFPSPRRLTILD